VKALHLGELRELLQGPTFSAWWSDWQRAVAAVREARSRHEDLLSHSEVMAHRAERVRRAAQDALARAGAAKEERPRRAARKDPVARGATSLERSLQRAERAVVARRTRRGAERLLAEAQERRARAKQLAEDAADVARAVREAEARQAALLAAARAQLGCAAGTSFLYWRHAGDERSAFAVALADDPDGANIEVKALGVYTVGPERGVAFLEPARDASGHALAPREGLRSSRG
jgi:hypothetical protein